LSSKVFATVAACAARSLSLRKLVRAAGANRLTGGGQPLGDLWSATTSITSLAMRWRNSGAMPRGPFEEIAKREFGTPGGARCIELAALA